MKFVIHTFGCKVNTYDSGMLEQALLPLQGANTLQSQKDGTETTEIAQQPLVHLVNTCAVTAEASQQALRLARKIKREDPSCKVVVTGCAAQVEPTLYTAAGEVDLVIANSEKPRLPEILSRFLAGQPTERLHRSNVFRLMDPLPGGGRESHHTRAFLKIQDGCNSFCSFCIIPYARGISRSVPVHMLVSKVLELETQGHQEVVLTGVHIGDYSDGPTDLTGLVRSLLQSTKISRIRLSSLEPQELTEELLELFVQEPRMCPHLHMSIQSATTEVLHAMKRTYTSDDVARALRRIQTRLPQAFVGMDVIAGFPTETEDDFLFTYKLLSELPWSRLHVFPYSERQGTKAGEMEQLPMKVRKARAQRLRELSLARLEARAREQIGSEKHLILLRGSDSPPNENSAAAEVDSPVVDVGPRSVAAEISASESGEVEAPIKRSLALGISADYWHVELPENLIGDELRRQGAGPLKVRITGTRLRRGRDDVRLLGSLL